SYNSPPSVVPRLPYALILALMGNICAHYFTPFDAGLGRLLNGAQQLFRLHLISAGMLLVGLTCALLNARGQRIEARATRWRHA
ncbi:ABC transporter permease, partial [Pseudomonas aeruginosa]